MDSFVYLLVDEESKEALAVDSGWETRPVLDAALAAGAGVKYVVATHEHFDHTSTLRELAKESGARVVAHSTSAVEHYISVDDGRS